MKTLLIHPARTLHAALRLGLIGIASLTITSCIMPPGGSNWDGGSSGTQAPSTCSPCRGSGRCNTCNGTGRFLGFGDTSCNTCSGTGVCINCGGRGTW